MFAIVIPPKEYAHENNVSEVYLIGPVETTNKNIKIGMKEFPKDRTKVIPIPEISLEELPEKQKDAIKFLQEKHEVLKDIQFVIVEVLGNARESYTLLDIIAIKL